MTVRGLALISVFVLGCSPATEEAGGRAAVIDGAQAQVIVDAEDRSDADRQRDARRRPAELLAFAQIHRGAHVADIGAGSGYTTELLVRAVGPDGVVYGHNEPAVIEKYVSESWPARLAKPMNANVVRVDRSFAAPIPDEVGDLDVITMIFVYHDTPLYGVDRAEMNANLFRALRPGGVLLIVDHHAVAGAPVDETADTLHRIDEAVVKADLEGAGFTLDATGEFLANPEDARDQPFFKMDGPTDAFVHRWRKPAAG